jgi:sigma-B regulation protein RsbU (phosphoserine phosphatase)
LFKKIRSKITAVILVTAMLPLIVLGAVSYIDLQNISGSTKESSKLMSDTVAENSGQMMTEQIKGEIYEMAVSKAALVDEKLAVIENNSIVVANYAEKLFANPGDYKDRTASYLSEADAGGIAPYIMSAADAPYESFADELALTANAFDVQGQFLAAGIPVSASYLAFESGYIQVYDVNASGVDNRNYDARTRSWYVGAKETGGVFWTDMFGDAQGRGASISCAVPVYGKNGELVGVSGTGATMDAISEIIRSSSVGENGYAFLLNNRGQVVITPKRDFLIDENGVVTGENYLESDNEAVRSVAGKMVTRESGTAELTLDGEDVFVAYAPLSRTDWSIGIVMPKAEVLTPVTAMQANIGVLQADNEATINKNMSLAVIITLVTVAAAAILALIMSFRFSGKVSSPITLLTEEAGLIGKGSLDRTITVVTGDELEELAHAFNSMTRELKVYIQDFERVTADKERIATELNVATNIQASMLPHIFPPYPDRNEFDLFGSMEPAKEVGGDFYDFFLADEHTLAVVIADVSGKGVPAALFMVIAKTLIKNNAQMGKSPKEVFEEVNNILCENNEGGMFVTTFMGYLDVLTGDFEYVNAGHNPPCIKRAGGEWQYLPCRPGFVLAGMEDMMYKPQTITLGKNDMLYMYTDGVTEAVDQVEELYGETRLLDVLNKNKSASITEVVQTVRDDIKDFANGAEQADDITMLMLEYYGKRD